MDDLRCSHRVEYCLDDEQMKKLPEAIEWLYDNYGPQRKLIFDEFNDGIWMYYLNDFWFEHLAHAALFKLFWW